MIFQDKQKEVDFFNRHAESDDYNVFTDAANARLIEAFFRMTGLSQGAMVADLGCGSGVFTNLLVRRGVHGSGIDISPSLISLARRKYPDINFYECDVEMLPFPDSSFDGLLLSGLVHHFPDPTVLAREALRVLKPGGCFFAFDPNRRNPFMYFYRDRTSPLYSSIGVTENERPILAEQVAQIFRNVGFKTSTDYLSGLSYRYVASGLVSKVLPIYNLIDGLVFRPNFLRALRPFVLTYGVKP
jgi:ubiquinone/menaquinone biosynthesis C-methylase UbiE